MSRVRPKPTGEVRLDDEKLDCIRQPARRWLVPNPPTSGVSGFGLAGVAGRVQISNHAGSHPANVGLSAAMRGLIAARTAVMTAVAAIDADVER